MILEKNGKNSCSKRTKHIKVRYFFIQDKIENGKVSIQYCLTERMWSDILTKPLQGQQFRKMKSMVMNCPMDYEDSNYSNKSELMMYQNNPETSSQECVERDEEKMRMMNMKVKKEIGASGQAA